jgi:hypothetical protein
LSEDRLLSPDPLPPFVSEPLPRLVPGRSACRKVALALTVGNSPARLEVSVAAASRMRACATSTLGLCASASSTRPFSVVSPSASHQRARAGAGANAASLARTKLPRAVASDAALGGPA